MTTWTFEYKDMAQSAQDAGQIYLQSYGSNNNGVGVLPGTHNAWNGAVQQKITSNQGYKPGGNVAFRQLMMCGSPVVTAYSPGSTGATGKLWSQGASSDEDITFSSIFGVTGTTASRSGFSWQDSHTETILDSWVAFQWTASCELP